MIPHSAFRIPHSIMLPPDFVICGNVVRDLTPAGWVPGGTAVYAAAVARGLGRRVGVVTAAPEDVVCAGLAEDVAVARADVADATSYENIYTTDGRVQYLRHPGSSIPAETLPRAWADARVALLGPVYHEVGPELAERFTGRIGVCAQGFLRRVDAGGRVSHLPPPTWDAEPILARAAALFLSEEDLAGGDGDVPRAWLAAVPLVLVTDGPRGARLHQHGAWQPIPAVPADELDPTGAGDSFAAAFMVALDHGASAPAAARFAAEVAALAVQTQGPLHRFHVPRSTFQVESRNSERGTWNVERGTGPCP